ncbi:MAG TPA: ABC transporter permease, partial [Candidatus Synoicihabitans sp.]|nr:ABC transporter permease [Candidatus Synoicihabitans sp.]
VTALLIVAIGIGAVTSIFSVVNALVLRPLVLPEPERLALVYETNLSRNLPAFAASVPNYVDWKQRSTSWESLAAIGRRAMNVTDGDEPELEQVLTMTADFLPTLGIPLARGRGFLPAEDQPGQSPVAIITRAYWQKRYNGSTEVLGQTLTLDGVAHTIVGVADDAAFFEPQQHIIIPLAADLTRERRSNHEIMVYGRLKPGVTLAQADTEMKAVAAQMWADMPEAERGWSTRLVPLAEEIVGTGVRSALFILLAAVGVLLLIACANLSNLMLVRASARSHELAIRTALGASRWQIVRELLSESLLVTLTGGALGFVLALWTLDALQTTPLPRAKEIGIDFRVLVFASGATLLTGLLAGASPALAASRTRPQEALKGRAPRSGQRSRLRDSLVVAQMALSLTLLVGATLLARSFWQLLQVDPGFKTENVVTASLRPNSPNPARFYDQAVERIAALPGVDSVGLISRLPLTPGGTSLNVFPVGPAAIASGQSIQANWRLIHGDYFGTMKIPVLRGRAFDQLNPAEAAKSIVLSAALARALWADADPLGREVNLGGGNNPLTVVGVVGDVRSGRLNVEPKPSYYVSVHRFTYGPKTLVIRSTGERAPLIAALRETIQDIDPTVPLFQIRSMDELRADSVAQDRLLTVLLATFAGVALLLAALGTYGVVAFTVHQRTAEFGIRLAVGAKPSDIFRLVLGRGVRLLVLGLLLGLVGGLGVGRVLAAALYQTGQTDLVSYSAATAVLALAALGAALLPARRASRVDPLIALRAE